jgi:hypothetical protein
MPEDRCGGSLAGSESVNVASTEGPVTEGSAPCAAPAIASDPFLSHGDQRKVRAGLKMND